MFVYIVYMNVYARISAQLLYVCLTFLQTAGISYDSNDGTIHVYMYEEFII